MLPKAITLESVDIWFQDEARVGQQGTLTRLWARKGTRPRAVRQQQFEYAYVFGAVCPAKDKGIALVLPAVNSQAMALHLAEISTATPEGRHALVVMDQAPWHTTPKLNPFNNLSILPLPPASPELNPQEQLWQSLRTRYWANRCYKNFDTIVDACCQAWNDFCAIPGNIKTLCSRKWAKICAIN